MSDSMFDFNDAEAQRGGGVIPAGTCAKVICTIIPGGTAGPDAADGAILKAAKAPSDVLMLECEFTVMEGSFAKRKLWPRFTISGGKKGDSGVSAGWNVTKSQIRAMLESANGVSPADTSPRATEVRRLNGFRALHNLVFALKIGVEPGSNGYPDKNNIAAILTVDDKEYGEVMGLVQKTNAGWTIQSAAPQTQINPGINHPVNPMPNVAPGAQRPAWLTE